VKQEQFGSEWRRYTVLFSELVLEVGVMPEPTEPAVDALISIQFRHNMSAEYDIWVDDLAFLRP
jgi:hypothetical protein